MNAIAPRSTAAPAPSRAVAPVLQLQSFDQLVRFAEMAAQSDLMPRDYKGKPANIMLAVQMGSELGLAPMQAVQSIAVINGRPGLWGDGMIGLCRQSPLCEDIQERIEGEGENRTATCIAKRRGASPCTSRFSMADAKRAGLMGKQGPWSQYPDRMLQARARGFALRDAFPDLLRGLKTVEELRDYPDAQEDNFRGTTLDARAEPAQQPRQRQRDPVDDDAIPALEEPPPVDKLQVGTDRLLAKIAACETEDDLSVITGDKQIKAWREDKLAPARPELEEQIQAAIGDRYEELTRVPA